MSSHPILQLVRYKQWADRGLYEVLAKTFVKIKPADAKRQDEYSHPPPIDTLAGSRINHW